MPREAIAELVDRYLSEPAFRAALQQDPEGTVRRSGIALNEDELAALRSIDWSLPDEELQARVNKC